MLPTIRFHLVILLALFLVSCASNPHAQERKPMSEFASLEEIRAHYGVPGLGLAIVQPKSSGIDSTIEVSGVRKVGNPAPLQKNDPFHLGSCTKSMTATLISIAVAEGKFSYSTSLSKLFPKLEIHPGYNGKTLRDLLVHTSGIGNDDHALFEAFADQTTLERIWKNEIEPRPARAWISAQLLKQGPKARSGTEYSNPAFILLGHLLELTYGKNWEELLQKKIFQPLDMKSCGFGPVSVANEAGEPTRPWGHRFQDGAYSPLHLDNPRAYGPAGTAHCSLEDWSKYARYHLDGILKKRPLEPKIYEALYENPTAGKDTAGGWVRLERESGLRYYFRGSNTMNFAEILLIPSMDRAALSVGNAGGDAASEAVYEALALGVKRLGQY